MHIGTGCNDRQHEQMAARDDIYCPLDASSATTMEHKRKLETEAIIADALEEEEGRKRLKKSRPAEEQQSPTNIDAHVRSIL